MFVMYFEILLGSGKLDCNQALTVIDWLPLLLSKHTSTFIGRTTFVQCGVITEIRKATGFVFPAQPVIVETVSKAIRPFTSLYTDFRDCFLSPHLIFGIFAWRQCFYYTDRTSVKPPEHLVPTLSRFRPFTLEVSRVHHERSRYWKSKLDSGMLGRYRRGFKIIMQVSLQIIYVATLKSYNLGVGISWLSTTSFG